MLLDGPTAAAQSDSDYGGWFGITNTPVGTLSPLVMMPGRKTDSTLTVTLRVSQWAYEGQKANRVFGATYGAHLGSAAVLAFTMSYLRAGCASDGCAGTMMFGADLFSRLWSSTP